MEKCFKSDQRLLNALHGAPEAKKALMAEFWVLFHTIFPHEFHPWYLSISDLSHVPFIYKWDLLGGTTKSCIYFGEQLLLQSSSES